MEALSSIGIFFAGLGLFLASCGIFWYCTIYAEAKRYRPRVSISEQTSRCLSIEGYARITTDYIILSTRYVCMAGQTSRSSWSNRNLVLAEIR